MVITALKEKKKDMIFVDWNPLANSEEPDEV